MDYSIQMHSRIEEEVVLAPRRAPHPGRGTGPRPGAAGGDVRRRVRLHGAVVRQDARHPRVRLAARHRHHRRVRVQHHRHPGGPRHPRVQVAHQGQGLQPGPAQPGGGVPGEPARSASPSLLAVVSVVILLSGIAVEGQLQLQTDPISWVNPQSQAIKNINQLKAATGSDNELAMRISTAHPWSDQTVAYVTKFSHQLGGQVPRLPVPRRRAWSTPSTSSSTTSRAWSTSRPPGPRSRPSTCIAPAGIVKTTVADNGEAPQRHLPGPTDTLDRALSPW